MNAKSSIKVKLAAMNFMEFAVWGSYLTCMGIYLGSHGMGSYIKWFYAIQGIVSIFMPAIMGIIADKYIQPQRLLGICHLVAGAFMGACFVIGGSEVINPAILIACYTISVAFFMPTIALANTVAFRIMNDNHMDTVLEFPPIRVFGTVGFIAMMWFVNCFYVYDGSIGLSFSNPAGEGMDPRFQNTSWQFLTSGIISILLALYCFTLPQCKLLQKAPGEQKKASIVETLGLNAFKLFKQRKFAMFFIFSMLLGMCLQVTNGFAGPYISSFSIPGGEYADSFGAQNPTILTSLSQISEALCILLIPFFLRRFGIKKVMFISMMAWVFRFGGLGLGNPGDGLWLFLMSMVVYGVAFDFFNVSGAIFIERETDKSIQASAQGLFMLMTNGLGATIGTLTAGAVVGIFTHEQQVGDAKFTIGDWSTAWIIFALFALAVAISFIFLFKYKHVPESKKAVDNASELPLASPEGFTYDGVDESRNSKN